MNRLFPLRAAMLGISLALALFPAGGRAQTPRWSGAMVNRLYAWLDGAPGDGLMSFARESAEVRAAAASNDEARRDEAATRAALLLLDAHRNGCCHKAQRSGWGIAVPPALPMELALSRALALGDIDGLFARERPAHPYYRALRDALAGEADPVRREKLQLNMDRWRWMPRDLGRRYLLVNTAAYQATLWEDGREVGLWPVVVGKTGTPTPIFSATISGVTFNPWWEIPQSIVAESVGALVRNRPAEATRRGYVVESGRYRQRPGPGNALGQMKLVMPNPHAVYLHDTPSKGLFGRETRAFSHGCVRVGDALGLATALLATNGGWSRADTESIVRGGITQTVSLEQPIPVYIAYFTAEPTADGRITFLTDVYGRDRADGRARWQGEVCPA